MRQCKHQSLHLIGVAGAVKPAGAEWYECNSCGDRVLVQIVASYPMDRELRAAVEGGVPIKRLFVAKDGAEFGSLEETKQRNALIKEATEISLLLIPRSPDLDAGQGYLQQDLNQVESVMERLRKLLSLGKTDRADAPLSDLVSDFLAEDNPLDWPGRFDGNPIFGIYRRLSCIDSQGREWQTPDLAEHPEIGKQVELRPSAWS